MDEQVQRARGPRRGARAHHEVRLQVGQRALVRREEVE